MTEKLKRYDLRVTGPWSKANPYKAILLAIILFLGGLASSYGVLRWDAPFINWSFAILVWTLAAYVFLNALAGIREKKK